MTIAPISVFGNTSTSIAGLGGERTSGMGGFAAFFAALLGGGLGESLGEDLALGEAIPADLESFMSLLKGGEGDETLEGGLGSLLSAFIPEGLLEELGLETDSHNSFSQAFPFNSEEIDGLEGILQEHSEGIVVYEKLVVEITKTVVQLSTAGIDVSSIAGASDLAKAYEKLGMNPAEAAAKAERIMAAIAVMKERFDIEITGEEVPSLISTVFNMSAGQSDVFRSDLTFTQISAQISKTMIAFEAGGSLSSGDIGMAVLKGEPLQAVMQDGKGVAPVDKNIQAETLAKPLSVPTESGDEFVELSAKDLPKVTQPVVKAIDIATPVVAKDIATKTAEISPSIFANSAAQMEDKERSNIKRDVTNIAADKVIRSNVKSENLFTVKPQPEAELTLELETAEGDVVNLDNMDENFDEVMETVSRRTSLDARVEGRSQQAIIKQANIASQVDIQIKSLIKQNGGQVRFRLDPPELGELDVKLKINNGTVRGTIVVQSIEAAEHLARDLRILQQSFDEAGLTLHEEGLQFRLKSEDESAGQQQTAGKDSGQGEETDSGTLIDTAAVEEDSTGWVKPDTLVDVSI